MTDIFQVVLIVIGIVGLNEFIKFRSDRKTKDRTDKQVDRIFQEAQREHEGTDLDTLVANSNKRFGGSTDAGEDTKE